MSIVLQATSEFMARREALRLFPEHRHGLTHMQVSLAQYAEIDWESGRSLVIKRRTRREIPAAVAEISRSFLKNPPRLKGEEGGEE